MIEFLAEQIEKLRQKLLDTSRRTNLINFNHSPRSSTHIRIVDEIPQNLWAVLESGKSLTFKPLPDLGEEPPDEKTDDYQQALAEAKKNNKKYIESLKKLDADEKINELDKESKAILLERELRNQLRADLGLSELQTEITLDLAAHARIHEYDPNYNLQLQSSAALHTDSEIQTLLLPKNLERRLQNIRSQYDSRLRDTGINTLNLGLFFLDWYSERNQKASLSPLFLAPIEITREKTRRGYAYPIKAESASIYFNETLVAALSQEGIELLRPDQSENESIQINQYINNLQNYLDQDAKFNRWKIRNFATFGFFHFSNVGMFHDLDPSNWRQESFLESDLLSSVLGATETERFPNNDDIQIDKLVLNNEAPPLVLDADSSQHAAISAAYDSTSVVIQGPPGTGKSQTIANLIGALVSQGKKVLFLAEKQPALDVVANRFKNIGLEYLLLEPSDKLTKEDFYKALERRLKFTHSLNQTAYDKKREEIVENMTLSRSYGDHLSCESGFLETSIFELIWKYIHLEKITNALKFDKNITLVIGEYSDEDAKESSRLLGLYYDFVIDSPPVNKTLELFTNVAPNQLTIGSFINSLEILRPLLIDFNHARQNLSKIIPNKIEISQLKTVVRKAEALLAGNVNLDKENLIKEIELRNRRVETIDCYLTSYENIFEYFSTPNKENFSKLFTLVKETHWEELSRAYLENELSKTQSELKSFNQLLEKFVIICPGREHNLKPLYQEITSDSQNIEKIKTALSLGIDLSDKNSTDLLIKLRAKLDSIKTLIENIHSQVPLLKLIREGTVIDLERAAHTVKNSNIFSVLNKDYRKQKSFLSSIGIQSSSSYDLLFTLPKLISIKKEIKDLEAINKHVYKIIYESATANSVTQAHTLINTIQNRDVKSQIFHLTTLMGAPLNEKTFDALIQLFSAINIDTRNLIINCEDIQEISESFLVSENNINNALMLLDNLGFRSEALIKMDSDGINAFVLAQDKFFESENELRETNPQGSTAPEDLRGEKLKTVKILENFRVQQEQLTEFGILMGDGYAISREKLQHITDFDLPGFTALSEKVEQSLSDIMNKFGFQAGKVTRGLSESITTYATLIEKGKEQGYVTYTDIFDCKPELDASTSEIVSIVELLTRWNIQVRDEKSNAGFAGLDIDIPRLLRIFDEVLRLGSDEDALFNQLSRIAAEREVKSHHFLRPFFDSLNDHSVASKHDAENLLNLTICKNLLLKHNSSVKDFLTFNGGVLNKLKVDFKKLDKSLQELEQSKILALVSDTSIPRGVKSGRKSSYSDKGLIEHQLGLKRRIGLRALITRSFDALLALNPVWFMQPQNVSKYLPKKLGLFDTVIIDEASQMLPQNALSAIARGKQLIVVGDSEQMPPSMWFQSDHDDDDDEDMPTEESILQLCEKRLPRSISLLWHYRSKHPDLIRFSNEKFYEGSLRIFPSPLKSNKNVGVENIKVEGVFQGQVNIVEAQRVILEAKRCMVSFPESSFGIVTMNIKQREYIEEELNRLADTDREIQEYYERWNGDVLNYPFVKNLERVQGDERDIIIISTLYGPDESGNVFQRFGPINRDVGYRRLNVLYTRARQKIIHVTSLNSSDIKMPDRPTRGLQTFKDYIEYAATGRVDGGQITGRPTDSDFELAVCRALQSHGFEVQPQVGVKGFLIDIGVSHSSHPHGFIAGVECDGATYHSSPSARDRDKVRQDVLESLGWRIYRIWSTDWFANHQKETAKLIEYLSKVIAVPMDHQTTFPVGDMISQEDNVEALPTIESQDEIVAKDLEYEEVVTARGTLSEVEINERILKYYMVSPNYFEYWKDEERRGSIEKQFSENLGQGNGYGDALKNVARPKFVAIMEFSEEEQEFENLARALLWIDRLAGLGR